VTCAFLDSPRQSYPSELRMPTSASSTVAKVSKTKVNLVMRNRSSIFLVMRARRSQP